jgi:hypothetical protein
MYLMFISANKARKIFIFIVAFVLLFRPTTASADSLDQSNTSAIIDGRVVNASHDTQFLAQQFYPSSAGELTRIVLKLSKFSDGNPTGNIWVEIWSNSDENSPLARIKESSFPVSANTITAFWPTQTQEVTFTWNDCLTLTHDSSYWIVIKGDYPYTVTNGIIVNEAQTDYGVEQYFNGIAWEYIDRHFWFEQYVGTCVSPTLSPKLTVIKIVENNNGGTATVNDFNLKVGDTSVVSGEVNSFSAGTYTAR